MKSNNIIFIHIIFFFSSYIFSQITPSELLIKREVETLREKAKLESASLLSTSSKSQHTEYSDTLTTSDFPKADSKSNSQNKSDLDYYGYNILSNFPERIIWDNRPPPDEYMLGTGDEVIIEIWGDTQLREVHIIDQYGKINIDKIGQINLSGLALKDLQSKLISKFQNVYSSLKGPDETAYLDISIGKLKSINVTFVGESVSPGIHAIHPFSTIITGLMQTGGISSLGSLRDIQIIRNGKQVVSLDIYDYLSNGDTANDRRLLEGDVLFVPIRYSTIFVNGQVMRPAIYEHLPNETLSDIINYAGGLTAVSKQLIRVHRARSSTGSSTSHLVNYNANQSFILKNGDTIEAYEMPKSDHNIYIFGQVKNPGSYAFDTEKETSLLDILKLAGGVDDKTYRKTMYQNVGEIIRNNSQTNYPEIIKFNIEKLIAGDMNENKILQNWDIILIRENPNYKSPKKVLILGEVNVPGVYALQKKWENLDDIIKRAGGFTDNAFHGGIQLYRNSTKVALNDFEIILLDGDSLQVPEHPGVIQVLGEVNQSGFIQYKKNKNLKDYIENAGGFTKSANNNDITIIFANGDVRVKKWLRNPKIPEGTTIIVYKKEETAPFSLTDFATNIASIITSLATLFLLLNS